MSVGFNKRQETQGTSNSLWLLSSKTPKVEQCLELHWLFSTVKEREWKSHEGETPGNLNEVRGLGADRMGGGKPGRQFSSPGLLIHNITKTSQPVPLLILPFNSISLLSCY